MSLRASTASRARPSRPPRSAPASHPGDAVLATVPSHARLVDSLTPPSPPASHLRPPSPPPVAHMVAAGKSVREGGSSAKGAQTSRRRSPSDGTRQMEAHREESRSSGGRRRRVGGLPEKVWGSSRASWRGQVLINTPAVPPNPFVMTKTLAQSMVGRPLRLCAASVQEGGRGTKRQMAAAFEGMAGIPIQRVD